MYIFVVLNSQHVLVLSSLLIPLGLYQVIIKLIYILFNRRNGPSNYVKHIRLYRTLKIESIYIKLCSIY